VQDQLVCRAPISKVIRHGPQGVANRLAPVASTCWRLTLKTYRRSGLARAFDTPPPLQQQ